MPAKRRLIRKKTEERRKKTESPIQRKKHPAVRGNINMGLVKQKRIPKEVEQAFFGRGFKASIDIPASTEFQNKIRQILRIRKNDPIRFIRFEENYYLNIPSVSGEITAGKNIIFRITGKSLIEQLMRFDMKRLMQWKPKEFPLRRTIKRK